MADTEYVDSAHRRAIITSVLLAANALLALIMTVSYFMQLRLVNQFITGPTPTLADATANDARVSLLANINLILLIVTGIVFLFWIHRAYDSLSTIGAYGLNYSPGWAVGGFFVPILNFVRPYQVVREMWKASDPAVPDGYLWTSSPVSPLVLIWWILWIGSGLIGNYIRLTFNSNNATLDQLVSLSWILFVSMLIEAIDAVLAMAIVLGLDVRQQQKSRNPRMPVSPSPVVSASRSAIAAVPAEKKAASRGSAETFFQRGLAGFKKHAYERAISEFDLAIQTNPEYAQAYLQRGLAFYHSHRLVRALEDLNRAIELQPEAASAYVWRAIVHTDIGDREQAKADLQKAEELGIGGELRSEAEALKAKLMS